MFLTIASFLFFTGLVGALTWWLTRNDDHKSSKGYFLAGRSLSFPLIAGSLLLTNLSTEQIVGLNGDAYTDGLCVMVWEVVAVIALVMMAWFFLPRFLRSGVATVPEYLALRFGESTQLIANLIFLVAYVVVLLPIILYTGATGMIGILNLPYLLGIESRETLLWAIVITIGVIGSVYALFGGLRTVAVSDTLNGIGLLVGGLLVTYFALHMFGGDGGVQAGIERITTEQQSRLNSIGTKETSVPFGTIFSGIFLLNLFYWTTNQQIIQRTFGASSLAEGQKGVLLTGALKLLGPIYLVVPGMIAYSMFANGDPVTGDPVLKVDAYGKLVQTVLPSYLNGFFAAAILGAILSSFNSALNSSCTLFSLGVYGRVIKPSASEADLVRAGKYFGWAVAVAAMAIAPILDGQKSIFGYLQTMNGMYFIPLFAVVLIGMLTRRTSTVAANVGLLVGVFIIAIGYFVPPFSYVVESMHTFFFLGTTFCWLLVIMLVLGEVFPRATEFVQQDAKVVDLTPWKLSPLVGTLLIAAVISIYVYFADWSVIKPIEAADAAGTTVAEVVDDGT
ncbi:MAG: solute:sodium symporter family transporter [Pirellulaceae bacterium]